MNEQQTVTIESATQQIQAEQQAAVTVLTGTTQKALLTSHGASLVTKIEAIDISELETESEQQQAEIVAHADRLRQENDSIGSNQKQVIDANEFISEINQSSVSAGASISQAEQQQYSLLATATNEHQSAIDEQAQQHKIQLISTSEANQANLQSTHSSLDQVLENQGNMCIGEIESYTANVQTEIVSQGREGIQLLSNTSSAGISEVQTHKNGQRSKLEDTAENEQNNIKNTGTELQSDLADNHQQKQTELQGKGDQLKGDQQTHAEQQQTNIENHSNELQQDLTTIGDEHKQDLNERKTEIVQENVPGLIEKAQGELDTIEQECSSALKDQHKEGEDELEQQAQAGQNQLVEDGETQQQEITANGQGATDEVAAVGGEASQSIGSLLKQEMDAISTVSQQAFTNLADTAQDVATSVEERTSAALSMMESQLETVFASLQAIGESSQNQIVSIASAQLDLLNEKMSSSIQNISNNASTAIERLVALSENLMPDFTDLTTEVADQLSVLLKDNLTDIQEMVEDRLSTLREDCKSRTEELLDLLQSSQQQLTRGVERAKLILATEAESIPEKMVITLKKVCQFGIMGPYENGIGELNSAASMGISRSRDIDEPEFEPSTSHEVFEYLENLFEGYSLDLPISEFTDNTISFVDGFFEFDLSGSASSFTNRFSSSLSEGMMAIEEKLTQFEELKASFEDGVYSNRTDVGKAIDFALQQKAELDKLLNDFKRAPGRVVELITNTADTMYSNITQWANKNIGRVFTQEGDLDLSEHTKDYEL